MNLPTQHPVPGTPARSRKYKGVLAHLIVLLVIALPLFGHLDESPIHVWDEMRNVQSALEMNQTGELIVTTFYYAPETWNTKPPLMIWLLALSQRVFGYNELTARMPSALAAVATCLMLLNFLKRRTGAWLPGIFTIVILVTSQGYVSPHGTRSGDFDALLTLCTTAAVCCFMHFVEEGSRRMLLAAIAALTAAVLTKGVAGLFVCPALLLYILIRKKAGMLFRSRELYVGILGFAAIIGGYYFLREGRQPGYLSAMVANELGGRFNTVIEDHQGSFWMYYDEMVAFTFSSWMLLLIPASVAALLTRDSSQRRVYLISALVSLSVFLILSSAATKITWYIIPVIPFLSMICGLFLYQLVQAFVRAQRTRQMWALKGRWAVPVFAAGLIVLLAAKPYSEMLEITVGSRYPQDAPGVNDAGIYLKSVIAGERPLQADILCGYHYTMHYYRSVINLQGKELKNEAFDRLQPGMKVLTWDDATKDSIRKYYTTSVIENFRTVTIYRVEGKL